jgi:tagaturonate reductase
MMNSIPDNQLEKLSGRIDDRATMTERVIQFGTGILLRGLVDYAINKANQQNIFNGSVVMIKSTANGQGDEFAEQDNLYTVAIRGMDKGKLQQEYELNNCISRTLNANTQWEEVVQLAHQETLDIIVSNTTEAGILLDEQDSYLQQPPLSFPGKLLALLYERYSHFKGDATKGYTIVPTELISNNGDVLKENLLTLAEINNCSTSFIEWIRKANTFCNSLVDRIVSGKPSPEKLKEHWKQLEYRDDLLIECEPYILWAIEGGEQIKDHLAFYKANEGVVISASIEKYKELKLRLLNGTHTFMCGMALLKGFIYVRDAMNDSPFYTFLEELMLDEICPTLGYDQDTVTTYAYAVIDRFRNPFIEHLWHNITLNYTQKMLLRNLATIKRYYEKKHTIPTKMAECFAWYLHFMTPVAKNEKEQWHGASLGKNYLINDPRAPIFYELHQNFRDQDYVRAALAHSELWNGFDFAQLPGFTDTVATNYIQIGNSDK